MNLQSILDPIAKFMVWTFENIFEPLGNKPNVLFILVGIGGMLYWLNLQRKFNEKADREGGLK